MSDMKCPFCNGELVGTIGHPICRNQDCVMCDDPMPQDLLEELIYTRKALDVAVDAIKNATEYLSNQEPLVDVMAMNLYIDLSKAIDKITTLEQKGNK